MYTQSQIEELCHIHAVLKKRQLPVAAEAETLAAEVQLLGFRSRLVLTLDESALAKVAAAVSVLKAHLSEPRSEVIGEGAVLF